MTALSLEGELLLNNLFLLSIYLSLLRLEVVVICTPCAIAADAGDSTGHSKCLGGTWCDCQHKPIITKKTEFVDHKGDKFVEVKIFTAGGVPYLEGTKPYDGSSGVNLEHLEPSLVVTEEPKEPHGPSTADQSGAAGSSTKESG